MKNFLLINFNLYVNLIIASEGCFLLLAFENGEIFVVPHDLVSERSSNLVWQARILFNPGLHGTCTAANTTILGIQGDIHF